LFLRRHGDTEKPLKAKGFLKFEVRVSSRVEVAESTEWAAGARQVRREHPRLGTRPSSPSRWNTLRALRGLNWWNAAG
jgi:hypothetical protein